MRIQTSIFHAQTHPKLAKTVRYGFYPFALAITLWFIFAQVSGSFGPLGRYYPAYLTMMIASMLVLEWLMPIQPQWGMTWRSLLKRDIPMMLINGATIGATTAIVTNMAMWFQLENTRTQTFPWWLQAIFIILTSDFIWYWIHRTSHEGQGVLSKWLWKTHVHHHLPEQVYVLMHPAAHPLNSVIVRVIWMLPAIWLGASPEAIFAASVLTGFQGLMSHFNVDIRAGIFNKIFMGTQAHRYHHSANPNEGKNYAAVIVLWDWIFGTLQFQEDVPPKLLGVHERSFYPADGKWLELLLLPFRK